MNLKLKWRLRFLQILATLTGIPLCVSLLLMFSDGTWLLGITLAILTICVMYVLAILILKERGW